MISLDDACDLCARTCAVFGKKHRGTHAIGPCPPRLMSELPFFPTCCYIETFCPSDTLSMLFFPAAVSVLDLSIFADVHDGFASSVAVPSSFGLLPAELHPIAHLHALVAGMQVAWCHCSAPGVHGPSAATPVQLCD